MILKCQSIHPINPDPDRGKFGPVERIGASTRLEPVRAKRAEVEEVKRLGF